MPPFHRLRSMMRSLLSSEATERELDADMRSILELLTEEKMAQGMTEQQARRAARIELGGLEQAKQHIRDNRRGAMLESILHDAKVGLRMLSRQPGLTLTAMFALAVGIGATAAIYSVGQRLLHRPLSGVAAPEELAVLVSEYDTPGFWKLGYPQFLQLRETQEVFTDIAAAMRLSAVVATQSTAEEANMELDTGNYFAVLGIVPEAGRTIRPEDDRDGAPRVVMINHAFWQKHYGGDRAAVGQTIKVNGVPHEIIGVMPRNFVGLERDLYSPPDIWVPFHSQYPDEFLLQQRGAFAEIIGRLKSGMTLGRANAHMDVLTTELDPDVPGRYRLVDIDAWPAGQVQVAPPQREATERFIGSLISVAVLVTLVSCLGLTSFLLARQSSRREEIAIRVALGASTVRIVRQLVTEAALVAIGAGAAAMLLAAGFLSLLGRLPSVFQTARLTVDSVLNSDALWMALLLTVASAVVCAVVPAFFVSRQIPYSGLKKRRAHWTWVGVRITPRQVLLVGQVALSVILAVTAGLYLRSLSSIGAVNPGYNTESLLLARLLPRALSAPEREAFYQSLLARLHEVPDVQSAAMSFIPPLEGGMSPISRPEDSEAAISAWVQSASPGYFRTYGVPVIAGREFDNSAPDVAQGLIVNRVLADQLWPGQDPIGQPVLTGLQLTERRTITGVVELGNCGSLLGEESPCTWRSFPPNGSGGVIHIRTRSNPGGLAATLPQLVREVNSDVAISDIRTVQEHIVDLTAEPRIIATLSAALAMLGIGLVVIVCSSLFASMVRDSRRELAIRMALGASARRLTLNITARGMVIGCAGTAVGLWGAAMLGNRVADQLYKVSPTDSITWAAVVTLILATVALATYLPVRRLASTNVNTVLRDD